MSAIRLMVVPFLLFVILYFKHALVEAFNVKAGTLEFRTGCFLHFLETS